MEAVFAGGLAEGTDDVFAVGRGVDDVPLAGGRGEHGEAVVMLRGDHDVFDAGVFGELGPGVGVVLRGVELFGELAVFGDGNFAFLHDPFADAFHGLVVIEAGGDGVDAPMDEHAEAGVAPPLHAGVALGGSFVGVGLGGGGNGRGRYDQNSEYNEPRGKCVNPHVETPGKRTQKGE